MIIHAPESLMLGGINQKQDGWFMFESKDHTVKGYKQFA